MEQKRKPRNKPTRLIYDKGGNNIQWKKEVSSISSAGKTEQLQVKKVKLDHSPKPDLKKKKTMNKRPKCKTRHYKTTRGKQAEHSLI